MPASHSVLAVGGCAQPELFAGFDSPAIDAPLHVEVFDGSPLECESAAHRFRVQPA